VGEKRQNTNRDYKAKKSHKATSQHKKARSTTTLLERKTTTSNISRIKNTPDTNSHNDEHAECSLGDLELGIFYF
jgi:hypothetical protein